jgi:hypothetical protein
LFEWQLSADVSNTRNKTSWLMLRLVHKLVGSDIAVCIEFIFDKVCKTAHENACDQLIREM